MATVSDIERFYKTVDHGDGTHLALRWNGRVRFTIPRKKSAQEACWKTFRPGRLELGLRAMASFPRLFGSTGCVEAEPLASVREAIGDEAGLSCCRTGTPGPWSKDTILFLNKTSAKPLYIVKAGAGKAVDLLLDNEAHWLRALRNQKSLHDHIPELVAHRTGENLSFVAERPLEGEIDRRFGILHIEFLKKLQEYSQQTIKFEESRLYTNMRLRMSDLGGLLSETWSHRFDVGMRRIEQSLSVAPILLVAAHNDFTQWNVRIDHGVARVFDWEYADHEQLPFFDPLHFLLMPMGLKREPPDKIIRNMLQGLQMCQQSFDAKWSYNPEAQALAYLINLCTRYLWSVRGTSESDPVVQSYAPVIDFLCRGAR
jgi:hypothetical protein